MRIFTMKEKRKKKSVRVKLSEEYIPWFRVIHIILETLDRELRIANVEKKSMENEQRVDHRRGRRRNHRVQDRKKERTC